jgi:hypothetical protein
MMSGDQRAEPDKNTTERKHARLEIYLYSPVTETRNVSQVQSEIPIWS